MTAAVGNKKDIAFAAKKLSQRSLPTWPRLTSMIVKHCRQGTAPFRLVEEAVKHKLATGKCDLLGLSGNSRSKN